MTVNRFCSSGLQTIALAAQRVMAGEGDIYVAGGVESISLVQNEMNKHHFQDEWLHRHKPETYWPMLQTAEYVARRYDIPREKQDEYGVQSQNRAAKARAEGKFKDEIAPITTKMKVVDKNTGHETMREVTASEDEGIRADTTYEGVSQIKPAIEGGCIAAGNASQFSDGASACVVMSDKEASRRGLTPLGIFRGFAAAGCDPKEMGIGPVFAVPKLLEQAGKSVDQHRPVGAERGLRGAGDLLPRPHRHPARPAERERRRDRARPSLRHVRRAPHRPRAHRGQAPRREVRRGHDVHRRRHGRRGSVRGRLITRR